MKFYCIKYWATKGIVEFEGKVTDDGRYVSEVSANSRFDSFFLTLGKHAFLHLEEAMREVEHLAHLNMHSKERALKKAKELMQKATDRKIKVVPR